MIIDIYFLISLLKQRASEPLNKSKAASVTQRKLRLMHSLSLYNMAQSRRSVFRTNTTNHSTGRMWSTFPKLTNEFISFFCRMSSLLIKNGLMLQCDNGYSIQDMVSSCNTYNLGVRVYMALSTLTSTYISLYIYYTDGACIHRYD